MRTMSSKRSKALTVAGSLMIAAAAALALFNHVQDVESGKRAKDISERIKSEIVSNAQDEVIYQIPTEAEAEEFAEAPGLDLDGIEWIGLLEIPSLEIELPVSRDCNYDYMKSGLCRYSGNAARGDMIVCGHNYKSFLQNLSDISEGDEVYFTDCSGRTYKYEVSEVQLIGGWDRDELFDDADDWQLTVFTCNYSGYSRFVVRCVAV